MLNVLYKNQNIPPCKLQKEQEAVVGNERIEDERKRGKRLNGWA
jgi:hypothetical protein